jgi:hypothetical protein
MLCCPFVSIKGDRSRARARERERERNRDARTEYERDFITNESVA